MTERELNIQKEILIVFAELENNIIQNNSRTTALGWQQRNELITHVNSGYNNHAKMNLKRNEWNASVIKGNVLKWIHKLFLKHKDIFGYFENYEKILLEFDSIINTSVRLEEYEVTQVLVFWRKKFPTP